MTVKLQGDAKRLTKAMQQLGRVNFTALHKEIGEVVLSSTQERFKTQKGPDGRRWKPSGRVAATGGQTLSDTRDLRNSLTVKATAKKAEVGTNKRYALVHQEGKLIRARRKPFLKFRTATGWVQTKQVKMPARPFLGISSEDRQEIKVVIRDHLQGAME